MKYAYLKNGNVIAQLKRNLPICDTKETSGPDAFICDFLRRVQGQKVLMLSQHTQKGRYSDEFIMAQVYPLKRGFPGNISNAVILFVKVLSRLNTFKPERIICGRLGPMLWAATLYSRICSVPIAYSCHNRVFHSTDPLYKRVLGFLDSVCIRKASACICHGPYLVDHISKLGVDHSQIIEFDVDFQDMLEEMERPMDSSEIPSLKCGRYILFVGRLEKNKGIFDLLKASREVLSREPDVKLVYIGNGTDFEQLLLEVEGSEFKGRIELLGEVSHSGLASIIKNCRFLVTPTQREFPEGRCMAAMEALVLGIPVIAPKFGPFQYLVKHKVNGLLFTPDNVGSLQACINLLFESQVLYDDLKAGARRTGDELMRPDKTFGEAVECAFYLSSD